MNTYALFLCLGILVSYLYNIQSNSSRFVSLLNPFVAGTHNKDNLQVYEFSPTLGIDLVSKDPATYQFNWAHWINLTDQLVYQIDRHSGLIKPPSKYARQYVSLPYFNRPPSFGLSSERDICWIGHSYLALHAPSPARLIFLSNDDTFVWHVDTSEDDYFYNSTIKSKLHFEHQVRETAGSFIIVDDDQIANQTDHSTSFIVEALLTDNSINQPTTSEIRTSSAHILDTNITNKNLPTITPQPKRYGDYLYSQDAELPKAAKGPFVTGRQRKQPDKLLIFPDKSIPQFLAELAEQGHQEEIDNSIQTALNSKAAEFSSPMPYPSCNGCASSWDMKYYPSIILAQDFRYHPTLDQNPPYFTSAFDSKNQSQKYLNTNGTLSYKLQFDLSFVVSLMKDLVRSLVPERFHFFWLDTSNYNHLKYDYLTYEELVRRVYVSIDKFNLLPPLYTELTVSLPHTINSRTVSANDFEKALDITATRVLLNPVHTKNDFLFSPKNHTVIYYSSLLPNKSMLLGMNTKSSVSLAKEMGVVSDPSLEELFHAKSVLDQLKTIETSDKYFREVSILVDDKSMEKHADWRFFRKQLNRTENVETLHRIYRAWSRFTAKEGVISWLAHGTLLGWYWNGLSMPYDQDMDLQMPVAELDRLARKYNNTLIVQDPNDDDRGNGGRYLLEVSPTYVERQEGNGNNIIDARFVDIETGSYIDLTGLAVTPSRFTEEDIQLNEKVTLGNDTQQQTEKRILYACKHNHLYSGSELFPLRLTLFEGAPAYVPNNYRKILRDEYRNYDKPDFGNEKYSSDLRMWIEKDKCEAKLKNINRYNQLESSKGRKQVLKEKELLARIQKERFCNDKEIEQMYHWTKRLTKMHEMEMELVSELTERGTKPIDEIDGVGRRKLAFYGLRQPSMYINY